MSVDTINVSYSHPLLWMDSRCNQSQTIVFTMPFRMGASGMSVGFQLLELNINIHKDSRDEGDLEGGYDDQNRPGLVD